MTTHDGLEVLAFDDRAELRAWLASNHATHAGLWVRVVRVRVGIRSAVGDLQRFTRRRGRGTASERNRRMTAAGYRALNMPVPPERETG